MRRVVSYDGIGGNPCRCHCGCAVNAAGGRTGESDCIDWTDDVRGQDAASGDTPRLE